MLLSSKNALTETSRMMFDHISEYHASARMTQIYYYSQIGKNKQTNKQTNKKQNLDIVKGKFFLSMRRIKSHFAKKYTV